MALLTNQQLSDMVEGVLVSYQRLLDEFDDWMTGEFDGGPGSDGLYPLTDRDGVVHLTPCPSKLASELNGPANTAVTSASLAAASAVSAAYSEAQAWASKNLTEDAKNAAATSVTAAQAAQAAAESARAVAIAQATVATAMAAVIGSGPTVIAPTLLNSWANFGSVYETAGYYKDPFGRVHLRGMIADGAAGDAFLLPVGYRPAAQLIFNQQSKRDAYFGTTRVDVRASGVVQIFGVSPDMNSSYPPNWISLSGISFLAA